MWVGVRAQKSKSDNESRQRKVKANDSQHKCAITHQPQGIVKVKHQDAQRVEKSREEQMLIL